MGSRPEILVELVMLSDARCGQQGRSNRTSSMLYGSGEDRLAG